MRDKRFNNVDLLKVNRLKLMAIREVLKYTEKREASEAREWALLTKRHELNGFNAESIN